MSETNVNGSLKSGDEAGHLPKGRYKIVVYDLETTGKSLIDEICHIGCYVHKLAESKEEKSVAESESKGADEKGDKGADENGDKGADENGDSEKRVEENGDKGVEKNGGKIMDEDNARYSQYIMPHRNLSFSARNAYGLVVVSLDYQRMLRDIHTGRLLKTKSEISALKDWMKWLEEVKGDSDGIILVHHAHDQSRDLHVPLLLLSLGRYNLITQFSNIVKGFCNSVNVISDLGDKSMITSLSLRSLCKTVLKDISLPTNTARERCTRINDILTRVISPDSKQSLEDKVLPHSQSMSQAQANLHRLETLQKAQYSMRPIFAEHFSSGYKLRSQMVGIRRTLAEQGMDYNKLVELDKQDKLASELEKLEIQDEDHKSLMIKTVTSHFEGKSERMENESDGTPPLKNESASGPHPTKESGKPPQPLKETNSDK